MLYEILEPDFKHIDERGGLIQLVGKGYSQVNYIYSDRNSVRGNHYHRQNTEAFYIISGSMTVVLEDVRTGEKTSVHMETGDMFRIPPYVRHTFTYHEDTGLVSMYDKGVELGNGKMDIWVCEGTDRPVSGVKSS